MITEFVKSDKSPKFDVVFIDEAQDLSLSNGIWQGQYGIKQGILYCW